MAWRDKVRQATYKGIPFTVVSTQVGFGRRGTLHEYPFRDKPYAEDLGRKAREITVQGFIDDFTDPTAADYIELRDRLIDAIENNNQTGTLILPTVGEFIVRPAEGNSISFNNSQGGRETFTLAFVEAGESELPVGTVNTKETTKRGAFALTSGAGVEAATKTVLTQDPDTGVDESKGILDRFIGGIDRAIETGEQVADELDVFQQTFNRYKADARDLLFTPADYWTRTGDMLKSFRNVYQDTGLEAGFQALVSIFKTDTESLPNGITVITADKEAQATNNQLLNDTFRNQLVAEMADITAEQTFESVDAINRRKKDYLGIFDQQIESAGINRDQFQRNLLIELRSNVLARLNDAGQGLPEEVTFEMKRSTPLVVVANEVYGDATRGEEVGDRNQVINPILPPAYEDLNILSA
jgi:prophage DNA circulation protein